METKKRLLVIGGRGALGQEIVSHFKGKNVWVVSADHGESDVADVSIKLNSTELSTTTDQARWIEQNLRDALKIPNDSRILDGIICVAGGWTGGNVTSDQFLKSVDLMWKQSVESSAVAAYLAGKLLKECGILVLTGAQVALNPTPAMIGYGMAKAAVHHLIKTLAAEDSGLPKNSIVVGLLPRILDTPNNRKFAADTEDFTSWTPLKHVSGLIEKWLEFRENSSIQNGSLAEVITNNGKTTVEIH